MFDRKESGTGAQRPLTWIAGALLAGLIGGAAGVWVMTDRAAVAPGAQPTEAAAEARLPTGMVEIDPSAQRNAGIKVLKVTSQVLPAALSVTGVVAPVESRVAHVRPLARGVIERLAVSLGARVSEGQTLLTYDNIQAGELTGEYLVERASLQQATSDFDVRQRALDRAEALIKIEAVSQQDLELRRSEVRNAQAAIASAKARIARIEEQLHRFGLSDADLARLTPEEGEAGHRTASHIVLRAPLGGVVTKFDVASGEIVEPERELFTIADLSTVWVLADVYEKDLAKLPRTGAVEVRTDAYPDRIFRGQLTYVSDVIDPKTRTAKVRCVVANADDALKLDMFATVSIPTTERRQSLVVPVAAVQQIDNQPVVFVRRSESRFERKAVTLGQTAGGFAEVLDGVTAGDEIVADGSFYLKTALLRERIGEGD